jgi:uncharacterized iron-regulated protein
VNLKCRLVTIATGAVLCAAPFSVADTRDLLAPPDAALTADVVFIGEQHDNPTHHDLQASWVEALQPKAIVFEMLTEEQAAKIAPANRMDEGALESALEWEASGWPDFAMYHPIFTAATDAEVVGAGVPRARLKALMQEDLSLVMEPESAKRFGLDRPLPQDQQQAREALQRDAHCNALPEEVLPRMVSVQRLRDATLAEAALDALERLGPPVVVITGNGHAREDWGAPFLLHMAAPELSVFSLGQGEAGEMPTGGFDAVLDGPPVDRGNPCDAFK